MEGARSLTLVLALITSAIRVTAQETTRLAADPASSQASRPAESPWARLRNLAPGTDVVVTPKGSPPGKRYILSADESGLTVLNLDNSMLPAATSDVLRDLASRNPAHFTEAQQGGTFLLDKNLRLTRNGVFIGDRKIADLGQVVETIARTDVVEIKARRKGRGVWGHLGTLGGYFVGTMSGGFVAGFACQAAVGRDRCDTGAFLTGALVGGIAGGVYGFRAANRERQDVIYRAP